MIPEAEMRKIVDQLRQGQRSQFGPWTFAFTPAGGEELGIKIHFNVFSAKVHRSTTEEDWADMGAVCKAIGVPASEKCIGGWPKTIEINPDATHYWWWE